MAEYFHKPTKTVLTPEEVRKTMGMSVESVCKENLDTYGLLPIVNKVREGVLENQATTIVEEGGVAVKVNSPEDLPLNEAKQRLTNHIQVNLNAETQRLLENSGFSIQVILLAKRPDSEWIAKAQEKVERSLSLLERVEECSSVKQLKEILVEFDALLSK